MYLTLKPSVPLHLQYEMSCSKQGFWSSIPADALSSPSDSQFQVHTPSFITYQAISLDCNCKCTNDCAKLCNFDTPGASCVQKGQTGPPFDNASKSMYSVEGRVNSSFMQTKLFGTDAGTESSLMEFEQGAVATLSSMSLTSSDVHPMSLDGNSLQTDYATEQSESISFDRKIAAMNTLFEESVALPSTISSGPQFYEDQPIAIDPVPPQQKQQQLVTDINDLIVSAIQCSSDDNSVISDMTSLNLEQFRNNLVMIINDESYDDETRQRCREMYEKFESMTEIDLRGVKLSKEVVTDMIAALETNTNVRSLDLSGSLASDNETREQIGGEGAMELANVLPSLVALKSLSLSGQNLGDEGATALARALESNTTLESLNLDINSIASEGATALARALESNTTLEMLCLGNNSIGNEGATALARALESNTTLKELSIENNAMGKEGATALARALESNTTLARFYLADNSIGSKGATALAKALESNTTLETLCLPSNSIGAEGATALARVLESNTILKHLDLFSNSGGGDRAVALARALESNTSLKWLHLRNNSIGNAGATSLARALESNTTLETLSLDYNSIGNEGATALARALESNTALIELSLNGNSIGNEGAVALARALEVSTTLKTLRLAGNSIGKEGASALARVLAFNVTLKVIYLGNSLICNAGAMALAIALESNTSLETLHLNHNSIGNEGTIALSRALESNTGLETLHLCGNSIGAEGATALTKALESNTTLKWLHLRNNAIGTKGAIALARALESNSILRMLNFRSNSIGDEGATALARALESNASLETLYVDDNSIGSEGAMALASALKSNTTLETLSLDDCSSFVSSCLKKRFSARGADGEVYTTANEQEPSLLPISHPVSNHSMESLPVEQLSPSFSPSDGHRIRIQPHEITSEDVLCGRVYTGTDHPGNLSYLRLVAAYRDRHQSLGSRHGEKNKITRMIVDEIYDRGGRFVKKESGAFYLLTLQEARQKVGQLLRDRSRKRKVTP